MKIATAAKKITKAMLKEMSVDGFWKWNGVKTIYSKQGNQDFISPTPWDINNGLCMEWAERVAELVQDGADGDFQLEDELTQQEHCMVKYGEKYYDAECQEGVFNPFDLPFFLAQKQTINQ